MLLCYSQFFCCTNRSAITTGMQASLIDSMDKEKETVNIFEGMTCFDSVLQKRSVRIILSTHGLKSAHVLKNMLQGSNF